MKVLAFDSQTAPPMPQDVGGELHVAGKLIDGKYRLERELGAGAMGRVWLARNALLDLQVAIKIVDEEQHGRDAMTRVMAEARLLAQLSHPNIVRVLDCHSDESSAYVVMELLEGCTLAELMEEGPLPAALVARMAVPLLDALGSAHRAGIVHRDIKPDNIFVMKRGNRICPKLLDFGIARSGPVQLGRNKRLVVGTPGYMSPEQAMGEDAVDERSDIWAMGVVMYEAISGESAFNSSTYSKYLRALTERKLPPLSAEGSAGLWMVLTRAMSHDSTERFATASELAATLRLWLRARGLREDLQGDSLPEHWAGTGSPAQRAFARAARRESVTRAKASGSRRLLPVSDTVVDPRVAPAESSRVATLATMKSVRSPAPRKRPLVLWAAAATVLCATLAMLHAHAEEGPKPRRHGPHAQAPTASRAQLSAADLREVAVLSHDSVSPLADLVPETHAASVVSSAPPADAALSDDAAPSKSGVHRIAKRRTRAAHSGMSQAAQLQNVPDAHNAHSGHATQRRGNVGKLDQMRLW